MAVLSDNPSFPQPQMRVAQRTSSGGHKFRISDVQLQKAPANDSEPCLTDAQRREKMVRRAGRGKRIVGAQMVGLRSQTPAATRGTQPESKAGQLGARRSQVAR